MEKARGEYLNFLDDDDLFFADHVETLVNALAETKNLAAYAFGFETPVIVVDKNPYKYQVKGYNKRYRKLFDEVELCYHNLIPIQCIMFSKQLYKELGGFDTSLEYLEDWDLWVRYAQKTRYSCVEKTTSIYRVPFEQNIQKDRQKKLDDALSVVRKKHESYYIPVSAARLAIYGKKESGKRICSCKYRSVIYGNEKESLMKAIKALKQAVMVYHRKIGELSASLIYGDSSPVPILDDADVLVIKEELGNVMDFQYRVFGFNSGTAKGHNLMAQNTDADVMMIMNPDVILEPNCLCRLLQPFQQEDVGMVEARQTPLEHAKEYKEDGRDRVGFYGVHGFQNRYLSENKWL